jgi:outer membrane protein assembly factor BamB
MSSRISRSLPALSSLFILFVSCSLSRAADQPQWGQAWTRNMISPERGLPESFDLETGRNIKWVAPLGTQTHGTPIVAGGRIFIGTNNEVPRNPSETGDCGVLLCLDEKDGHMLWQLVVPKRMEDQYFDWPKTGMASPVSVEGQRAYTVDNRGEVVCLDVQGMANGNDGPFLEEGEHMLPHAAPAPSFKVQPLPPGTVVPSAGPTDADIVWLFDMPASAGTWPHDGAHSSILIHGDYLYINTGTGVDNTHRAIRAPDAPSLIVLEKKTGRYVARDDEHIGPNIFHATWSSPSFAEVNGKPLIFFAGGDGVIRAFEPLTKSPPPGEVAKLKKVWNFDPDPTAPKEDVHRFVGNKLISPVDVYGMPVFYKNRIYVAGGGDIWWGKNEAWLKCIDASRTGDITSSGQIWSAPLYRHVMSTPAIADGLAFIADGGRKVYCIDAETGQEYWQHETHGEFWASPMVADGKVYIGTRRGDFWVFAASKEKRVLANIDFKKPISATVTAANGVLYVATMERLYAIQQGARWNGEVLSK